MRPGEHRLELRSIDGLRVEFVTLKLPRGEHSVYRLRFTAEVTAMFRGLVDRKERLVRGSVETASARAPSNSLAASAFFSAFTHS